MGEGGGEALQTFSFVLFSLFSRPRAGLVTVKSSFFSLATNTLNVSINNINNKPCLASHVVLPPLQLYAFLGHTPHSLGHGYNPLTSRMILHKVVAIQWITQLLTSQTIYIILQILSRKTFSGYHSLTPVRAGNSCPTTTYRTPNISDRACYLHTLLGEIFPIIT